MSSSLAAASPAAKILVQTFKKLKSEPVEGIAAKIPDESNQFKWRIYLEGPKDTMYQGGVFQLEMSFPFDYPMSPPELRFISDFWHPNVYTDGKVCISILHPPGDDPMSGELPEERWLPSQTVPTILLSVMSLLCDPNFSSPANVDASVQWRRDIDTYRKRVEALVKKANREFDGSVSIPHPDTDPEERKRQLEKLKELNKPMDIGMWEDDDDEFDMDDWGDFDDDEWDEESGEFDEEEEEEDD